jgi:hypothetical protein
MYNKPTEGTWHEFLSKEIKKRSLKICFLVEVGAKVQRANKFNFDG